MDVAELLSEAYGRISGIVHRAVDGLDAGGLAWRPDPAANSIGWLVWHLTRVQDDHVAELAGRDQVWETGPWAERFGLAPGTMDTGYGHSTEEVAAVRPEGADVLVEYLDAVLDMTQEHLQTLNEADLDRIIDTSWDPPVTMGVRLVSVVSDDLQHAGQAAYLRGVYDRTVRDAT